jgi:hypothetical protein
VPIGGAYRLIDVPMSNCINSGISKIYILTQFNSTSLNRHLARTYNMGSAGVRFGEGFVEVLAATQTPTDKEWFQGTADAVRQYSWLLTDTKNRSVEDVVILSGECERREGEGGGCCMRIWALPARVSKKHAQRPPLLLFSHPPPPVDPHPPTHTPTHPHTSSLPFPSQNTPPPKQQATTSTAWTT